MFLPRALYQGCRFRVEAQQFVELKALLLYLLHVVLKYSSRKIVPWNVTKNLRLGSVIHIMTITGRSHWFRFLISSLFIFLVPGILRMAKSFLDSTAKISILRFIVYGIEPVRRQVTITRGWRWLFKKRLKGDSKV